ncbi:MAG TPA: NAD(+)/NADH kinase [Acidimicrobiales bacterium]
MSTFGLIYHEAREATAAMAGELSTWLIDKGHDVRVAPTGTPPDPSFGAGLDLAISLGGDGNILRAVALVAEHDVPILGVNFGQLGYLTAVEPTEARTAIERVIDGDYQIERRMLLDVVVESATPELDGQRRVALNEAVLERTPVANTVRLGVYLDDEFFTTYAADGMIVATPTGSTAYAFSVRGPIIEATHRALQLTPVSPHMLFDRTLVLEPTARIRIEVRPDRPATLSVDGRLLGTLHEGDSIVCTASSHDAQLVTFGPRDFHAVLKAKFGLNDR